MWQCKNCNEENEDNFESCWNCGTSIDGKQPENFQAFLEAKKEAIEELEKPSFINKHIKEGLVAVLGALFGAVLAGAIGALFGAMIANPAMRFFLKRSRNNCQHDEIDVISGFNDSVSETTLKRQITTDSNHKQSYEKHIAYDFNSALKFLLKDDSLFIEHKNIVSTIPLKEISSFKVSHELIYWMIAGATGPILMGLKILLDEVSFISLRHILIGFGFALIMIFFGILLALRGIKGNTIINILNNKGKIHKRYSLKGKDSQIFNFANSVNQRLKIIHQN